MAAEPLATGPTSTSSADWEQAVWEDTWSEETLRMAYEEAKALQDQLVRWADALDSKIVQVFTASSVLITIAPLLGSARSWGDWSLQFLWLGICAWLATLVTCWRAYTPRMLSIGPNPRTLLKPEWMGVHPVHFQLYRLQEMGKSWQRNTAALTDKADLLAIAIPLAGAEVLCLALAILFSR